MVEKLKTILLVLGVVALLGYLGMHVKSSPHPERIVVVKSSGAACVGTISELLKKDPGVVGIASVAGTGELHVGIVRATSPDAVARRLSEAAVPAAVAGVMTPVEYRKAYGHYFENGTFATCTGECGR